MPDITTPLLDHKIFLTLSNYFKGGETAKEKLSTCKKRVENRVKTRLNKRIIQNNQ